MGKYTYRQTSDGMPYRVWEPSVPRIPDNILESTIYLYGTEADANLGVSDRGGTGFMVGVPSKVNDGVTHAYFITNQHVVAHAPVVRAVSVDGKPRVIPLTEKDWVPHPAGDDVVACPFPHDDYPDTYRVVQEDLFVTPELVAVEDIGVGDDVFMVSRMLGYEGRERNDPIVRFGNLSLGRTTRIEQTGQREGIKQESYVVEMRSTNGCSGSPVYWLQSRQPELRGVLLSFASRVLLLGIDWGHLPDGVPVTDAGCQTEMVAQTASAIATVVPAWKIKELLDVSTFKQQRAVSDAEEKERRAKTPAAVMDSRPKESSPGAFTKETFMRDLKKASKKLEE